MYPNMQLWRFILAFLIGNVVCQDVGFSFGEAIDSASATDTSFHTAGSISVNGFTTTVPKNLQVTGNFFNCCAPIAAQVDIAQFATQSSVGFISKVNYDSNMEIANGPLIRINDPNAVYSAGYAGSPFLKADDENPSISSFSGFSMCVPRMAKDPLCPDCNRPNIGTTRKKQGTL
ncbi:uncharacterized protein BCR38DRAFT_412908 [Pseudomassariella vexata]|uniref:Uncharacterized protein n=1 Tax=Pseudomassariella vexata TaxID=1141098 RepID=A0A1Y2DIZ5_9PEZI|nr:uncharacterized protein BCR38DRAFT_412908 [Pseudomassariella vexata]ORY59203.1 hypothetical protein BCR38DRAFT_412908 [Pseudomassariella vexata]